MAASALPKTTTDLIMITNLEPVESRMNDDTSPIVRIKIIDEIENLKEIDMITDA